MPSNSVAITGATSVTALWICKAFHEANWDTQALVYQEEEYYTGLKKKRIECLKKVASVDFDIYAEEGDMASWITLHQPSIWVHHHHFMEDYRSEKYDVDRALDEGIKPLDLIVEKLKENECSGIIFSGTYFESGEGNKDRAATTSYGETKTLIGAELKGRAERAGIPFCKVVIPDPVGPLEDEDRFLPLVIKNAQFAKPFTLKLPDQIADHIPLETIGKIYTEVADGLLDGYQGTVRPSGWVGTYRDWLEEINKNLLKELSLKLRVDEASGSTPYINRSNPKSEKRRIDWDAFWKAHLSFIRTGQPWRSA